MLSPVRPPLRIGDVARHAVVSPATVPTALNDGATVTVATRQALRAAINELGYRPNRTRPTYAAGRPK
jgi:DNA-binding LacI/PurR family transcriptional regulator